MRKLFYLICAVFVLTSCTEEQEFLAGERPSDKSITQAHEFQVPLEVAIDNLWSLVDHMEGEAQTRSVVNRSIEKVNFITIEQPAPGPQNL